MATKKLLDIPISIKPSRKRLFHLYQTKQYFKDLFICALSRQSGNQGA